MEARVPRYFFNVHDGRSEIDTEGTELADQDAARLMGVQLAGEILKDEGYRQMLGDTWHLDVLDGADGVVCRVDVSVSVPIPSG
ncbi:hypothetical protein ABIE45_000958 [Methylobacterium sp. OAE515]